MTGSHAHITLAIETSIGGGSVALFDGSERIDGFVGATGVSRAEDILPNIDRLLSQNEIGFRSISQVIVGAGPGSFTGIRIGISTAIGLAAAANIPVRKFSTLEAIACAAEMDGPMTAALPVGRGMVCVQEYAAVPDGVTRSAEPKPYTNDEFTALVSTHPLQTFIVSDAIFQQSAESVRAKMINVGDDLASLLARFSAKLTEIDEPLFIGKTK